MSKVVLANEYTPVSTACYGWQAKPKPQEMGSKKQVSRNQKTVWAREGVGNKDLYSGDLLAMMHEQTDKDLARQRIPNQEDFKQVERRMGKRMLHSDFVRKVLALNRHLIYEDSLYCKGSGAFYLVRQGKKIYTGACFRTGWMQEWTTVETDTADLVTREGLTYGWRQVLQRLLQQKALSYRQVVETFGDVYRNDLCGRNWSTNVGEFRN